MIRRLALPIVAASLLVACGGDDAPDAATGPAPTAAPATVTDGDSSDAPAGNAPAALQFTAPLVGGGQIDMSELGEQPVLLWFWAPW